MKDHLKIYSSDTEARLLLASAYSAKDGIFFRKFGNFARIILTRGDAGPDSSTDLPTWEIDIVFKALEAVPEPIDGATNVLKAVEVLSVSELPPGGYLYRATLKLVLFKFDFHHDYRLKIFEGCKVEPEALHDWFTNIEHDLQDMISDLEQSQTAPAKKETLKNLQKQIREANEGIKSNLKEHFSVPLVKLPSILKKQYSECS